MRVAAAELRSSATSGDISLLSNIHIKDDHPEAPHQRHMSNMSKLSNMTLKAYFPGIFEVAHVVAVTSE